MISIKKNVVICATTNIVTRNIIIMIAIAENQMKFMARLCGMPRSMFMPIITKRRLW